MKIERKQCPKCGHETLMARDRGKNPDWGLPACMTCMTCGTKYSKDRAVRLKPSFCEVCGTTVAKRFEWANVTGVYAIGRENWKRMCTSCHSKFDFTAEHKAALTRKGLHDSPAALECKRESMLLAWREGRRQSPRHGPGGRFIGHE